MFRGILAFLYLLTIPAVPLWSLPVEKSVDINPTSSHEFSVDSALRLPGNISGISNLNTATGLDQTTFNEAAASPDTELSLVEPAHDFSSQRIPAIDVDLVPSHVAANQSVQQMHLALGIIPLAATDNVVSRIPRNRHDRLLSRYTTATQALGEERQHVTQLADSLLKLFDGAHVGIDELAVALSLPIEQGSLAALKDVAQRLSPHAPDAESIDAYLRQDFLAHVMADPKRRATPALNAVLILGQAAGAKLSERLPSDHQTRYVAFEGRMAAGKSTYAQRAMEELAKLGITVKLTERGSFINGLTKDTQEGGKWSPELSTVFYFIDFWNRTLKDIIPAVLADAHFIFGDRGDVTDIARAMVRGMDQTVLETVFSPFPAPDMTLTLDTTVQKERQRAWKKLMLAAQDPEEFKRTHASQKRHIDDQLQRFKKGFLWPTDYAGWLDLPKGPLDPMQRWMYGQRLLAREYTRLLTDPRRIRRYGLAAVVNATLRPEQKLNQIVEQILAFNYSPQEPVPQWRENVLSKLSRLTTRAHEYRAHFSDATLADPSFWAQSHRPHPMTLLDLISYSKDLLLRDNDTTKTRVAELDLNYVEQMLDKAEQSPETDIN